MRTHTVLYVLTSLNLVLVGIALWQQMAPRHAGADADVLRGRALQIVDDRGRIRASISVLEGDRSAEGGERSDTVLLRLITEQGRPTVKIGASESSSGLSFAGPTGTRNAWLVLKTDGNHSSLRLRDEDGREQSYGP